eukprot:988935-Prymnesium_polylepis.1
MPCGSAVAYSRRADAYSRAWSLAARASSRRSPRPCEHHWGLERAKVRATAVAGREGRAIARCR